MSNKILVVDDETEIADLIEVYLKTKTTLYSNFIRPKKPLTALKQPPLILQFWILCFLT